MIAASPVESKPFHQDEVVTIKFLQATYATIKGNSGEMLRVIGLEMLWDSVTLRAIIAGPDLSPNRDAVAGLETSSSNLPIWQKW